MEQNIHIYTDFVIHVFRILHYFSLPPHTKISRNENENYIFVKNMSELLQNLITVSFISFVWNSDFK